MQVELHCLRDISWEALESAQFELLEDVQSSTGRAHLIASEPQRTYTRGRSAKEADFLLTPSHNFEIHSVTRGGSWTYHGPGQLLLYPIFRLTDFGYGSREVRRFINDFREAILQPLLAVAPGCTAQDSPFGIYESGAKLASFGIAIKQGVAHHGASIYVKDQKSPFRAIHPCGVSGQAVSSLQQLGVEVAWEPFAKQMLENVKKYFLPI